MTHLMVDVQNAAKVAVENWADEYLAPPYTARGILEWLSDDEVYLIARIYKGKGRTPVGQLMIPVPTLAYMDGSVEDFPGGPGTEGENIDYTYRWLRSNGDMGYSPEERLGEAFIEGMRGRNPSGFGGWQGAEFPVDAIHPDFRGRI